MNLFAYCVILIAAGFLTSFRPAFDCVCLPEQSVAEALQGADAVFLARVVSITNKPEILYSTGNAGAGWTMEEAELVVEKAWKNARVGERIIFISHDTSCSRSFTEAPGDPAKKLSGKWIVYAYGPQPYGLSICERSHQVTIPASPSDEPALDKLVRRR